jgi:thiamine pyrophosphokinase
MQAFIFVNGQASPPGFYLDHLAGNRRKDDVVICADGGYRIASAIGVIPDYIIGDMDSLSEVPAVSAEVIRYGKEKDFSDFELALRKARELEPERVYVYGALGGRVDHILTNFLVLWRAGCPTVFVEEREECYSLRGTLVLEGSRGKTCSLIPLEPCRVSTRGFKYPLAGETLGPSSRGLSNVIESDSAVVEVNEGTLIVVLIR